MCFRAERKMVESGGYQEWVPFSNLLKYKDLCLFTDMQVSLTLQTDFSPLHTSVSIFQLTVVKNDSKIESKIGEHFQHKLNCTSQERH